MATRKRLDFFDWPRADMIRVRFSPDGRYFAMAGVNEGRMMFCDLTTRERRPIGRGYRSGLHDLVFSTDGRRLVTAGTMPNGVVKIWDVETGRDVATLPGEAGFLFNHIGFSPDGKTLFANSLEMVSLLWRAPSWEEIEAAENRKQGP